MRDEVLGIMIRARRRLLMVRACEYSAILMVAAGLCAGALEIAWVLAPIHLAAAMPVCLLPVAGGVLVLQRFVRRAPQFAGGLAWMSAAICFSSAAFGCVYLLGGRYVEIPKLMLPAVIIPPGIMVAVAAALIARPSLHGTGVLLDLRLGLAERLSTATELATSGNGTSPSAEAVYCQALDAARQSHADSASLWNRSRATVGAVGLVVLLCVVLGLLPGGIAEGGSLDTLSAEQMEKLAQDFRNAASAAPADSALSEDYLRIAKAIELKDEQEVKRLLEKLLKAGVQLAEVTDTRLLAAAGFGTGGDNDTVVAKGNGAGDNSGENGPSKSGRPDNSSDNQTVGVYNPLYEGHVNSAAGSGDAGNSNVSVPRETAWDAARRDASSSLASGRVPARYRDLVRRYFQAETAED